MSTPLLQNKVALIVGGTSGIGRSTAEAMAAAGASVVIGGRRAAEGQSVVDAIRSKGGQAHFETTDVTDSKQIQALVAAAEEKFGGIDIAFNNAGTEGKSLNPLVEESEENLRQVMEINFFGVWHSMQAELPALQRRGGGVILNTTSAAGLKGFGSFSSYVASKFAVEGLSRSVAQEVALLGIRINTIAPGPIQTGLLDRASGGDPSAFTQFVPMQRAGTPEEVADMVTFLASDKGSYLNGSTFRVDGGMLA